MVSSDHNPLEKLTSTTLMLPKEDDDQDEPSKELMLPTVDLRSPGKILIREDTILGSLPGCASCGRAQLSCSGVKNQWNALCWGKQSDRKYAWLIMVLFVVFLFSIVGTVLFCFTDVISDVILAKMVISNNSAAYSMWKKPVIQPTMKVYVFNYTNSERVQDGLDKKLKVQEVGPFVYIQHSEKVNTHFNGDGTVTYQERNSFTFRPDLSSGHQFDQVTVPNLPFMSAISMARYAPSFAKFSLNAVLLSLSSHPFTRLPVHKFLWGYDDPILTLARPYLQLRGEIPYDRFGILVPKNGTVIDRITVYTGEQDVNQIGQVEMVNGFRSMDHWNTEECNRVGGSDGNIFPMSSVSHKRPVYVYQRELCRLLPFHYTEDVEAMDGILSYRYKMPLNVFDRPETNPDNQCYCHMDSGVCPPKGMLNVSQCAYGAPALISFPHFYLADESLLQSVDGLKPDSEKHTSYMDLHPTLGIPLAGVSRLQLNVQVRRAVGITGLGSLPDLTILPVAWIELSVLDLPESIRTIVYHGTYSRAAIQLTLSWGCALALIGSGSTLIVLFKRRKPRPCALIKRVPTEKLNELQNVTKQDHTYNGNGYIAT